jgi:hypothetical protein
MVLRAVLGALLVVGPVGRMLTAQSLLPPAESPTSVLLGFT